MVGVSAWWVCSAWWHECMVGVSGGEREWAVGGMVVCGGQCGWWVWVAGHVVGMCTWVVHGGQMEWKQK